MAENKAGGKIVVLTYGHPPKGIGTGFSSQRALERRYYAAPKNRRWLQTGPR